MTEEVLSVSTDTDQEKVARTIQRYDFLAVPVVDLEQRLVGIVTVDGVIDIIEQEATVISTPPARFRLVTTTTISAATCHRCPATWCGWRCLYSLAFSPRK